MYLPGRKKALLETVDKTPTMEPFLDETVDIACNFTKEKLYCRYLSTDFPKFSEQLCRGTCFRMCFLILLI